MPKKRRMSRTLKKENTQEEKNKYKPLVPRIILKNNTSS